MLHFGRNIWSFSWPKRSGIMLAFEVFFPPRLAKAYLYLLKFGFTQNSHEIPWPRCFHCFCVVEQPPCTLFVMPVLEIFPPKYYLRFSNIAFLRYFGIHTMWYLQSHTVWLKLWSSYMGSLLFLNFERFRIARLPSYSRNCQTLWVHRQNRWFTCFLLVSFNWLIQFHWKAISILLPNTKGDSTIPDRDTILL